MADNQMVKIQFDFDLGNVPASAKKFGEYLKGIETTSKQTTDQLKKLGDGIDIASEKMSKSGNNIKKSNQQWSNFALILQDLPYGFRGIQNNLPAVIGSFAGMTGPIYLASSALIAFFTAMDSGLIKFGNAVKLTTDYAKEAATAYSNESVQLESLYRVATNANIAMSDRVAAAKALKDEYPGLLGLYSAEDIALGKADEAYKKLTITLWQYAKAKGAEAALTEIAINQNKLLIERANLLDKFSKNNINNFSKEADYTADGIRLMSDYDKELDNRTRLLRNNATEYNNLEKSAGQYLKIQDANISSELQLNNFKKKPDDKKAIQDAKNKIQLEKEKLKAIENANNAEIKAFTETLDERNKKEFEAGLLLADNLEKMKAAGYSDSTTYYAAYRQQILNIAKYYDDKEAREQERKNKETAAADKVISDRNLQNSLDALKIQSDVETKILLKGGKSTAADRIKILENYKNKLYDLASVGGYTAEQFDKIDDALLRVDAAIAGSQDKVKSFNITWLDTINNINSVIMDFINNSMVALGESIGKALAGDNIDVINVFGTLLADALTEIGKQLIAFATASLFAWALLKSNNPITAAAALVAGIAAVAAGSFMKSKLEQDRTPKKFANGGIISGPTMGLMGEYPGAKSNPEVVAPLDKLKDLLGGQGGGGSFILKGQDLVLALNRSESSLKLRRGI